MIFGGGRQCLMTNAPYTVHDRIDGFNCQRTDNFNLIQNWESDKKRRNAKDKIIETTGELLELDIARVEYVLGK